jgi:hypothetical protein
MTEAQANLAAALISAAAAVLNAEVTQMRIADEQALRNDTGCHTPEAYTAVLNSSMLWDTQHFINRAMELV